MADGSVGVTRRGAVSVVTAPPRTAGVLTLELIERLAAALGALADDQATRVVILDGADDLFAGVWAVAGGETPAHDYPRRLSAAMQDVARTPLPVIAVIHGDALGAGLELALACDVRLSAEGARFGLPHGDAAALPLAGGVARLARVAGRAVAMQMLLTGQPLAAADALAHGLVSGVYTAERLMPETERLADVIASRGPIALRFAKEAVARGVEMPLDQALRFETDLTIILQTTADRAEGVRAFAEKRTPEFTGQ